MKKYVCTICGFVYEEDAGLPASGIAPGTPYNQLPDSFRCPVCGADKSAFRLQTPADGASPAQSETSGQTGASEEEILRELSFGELSAVCSNLARGCEKQYLSEEAALYTQLSEYFRSKTREQDEAHLGRLIELVDGDLNQRYPQASQTATAATDRGALRALTWNEKVTRIASSLLNRFLKEGDAFLSGTNVFVCDICGFLYVGEEPPALCPVCKVPGWKFTKVERR